MALETLKQIDPGTGLTLEDLIDAFITSPREAESLKRYLARDKMPKCKPMAVKWVDEEAE